MADTRQTDQLTPSDIKDPPAKRPCLEAASNGVELGGETPGDDGSDFYNTPLNAGAPIYTAQNVAAEESVPPTPPKPAPAIPGLSFVNQNNTAAGSQGVGAPSHDNDTQATSFADKPIKQDTLQKPDEQAPVTGDVEMGDTKPDAQRHEKEQDQKHTTAMEQLKIDHTSTVPENENESKPAEQKEESGELPGNANHTEGAEIGPDNSENPEWEVDSSPYESSFSDSSSDDSSDDDSEGDYDLLDPEEQARILMAAEGGSDDEGDGKYKGAQPRTANEKPDEIVPKPDVTVTPDMKVEMLGNVEAIVENVVLVKANISGEYQVLESGSVLCLADLSVIGAVSETLGRVEQPLYTVRFPNEDAVKEAKLEKGTPVFYVTEHSTFVFTQPLKGLKGSDASNFHDEEVGDEEIEFSDDEAEAEYKRQLKQKRQQKKDGRRGRDLPGPSGLRNTEINYDDVTAEDGYTPLSRPKNLHEMMGHAEAPLEESQPRKPFAERGAWGGGRGRGRGRGNDRGGRGRGRGGSYQKHGDDRHQPAPQQQQQQQQESHQHAYPPRSAEFRPPQNLYEPQNPYQQQQQAPPYNLPLYPPYQYPQSPMYNANQPFFPSVSPPVQQPFPFQPPNQTQSPYPPPGSHINPAFFRNLQQQQQPPQQTQPHQQPQQQPPQPPTTQSSAETFAAAQAQLDLLRRLSRGGS
ncbi:hypothetical protein AJ79_09151 [Helicocarpus griseus UAMH5409]|uniref:H/ACA ribonucleoprotein complex non-core subunit NAF1 n=1 Tax=Helicocarpus griseus UAMH5409 TaxID=1447875 RepID=A0A2B7WM22_9EURO|nr:hypothetical protein AJ79_09151 [Helicocarpus griseus UAMH5409]